jgi:hypothetical protein
MSRPEKRLKIDTEVGRVLNSEEEVQQIKADIQQVQECANTILQVTAFQYKNLGSSFLLLFYEIYPPSLLFSFVVSGDENNNWIRKKLTTEAKKMLATIVTIMEILEPLKARTDQVSFSCVGAVWCCVVLRGVAAVLLHFSLNAQPFIYYLLVFSNYFSCNGPTSL